jgi:DNA-binding MarR family transcriptional regulator
MEPDIFDILRSYPQIYLACHVEHRTRSSSPTGLTSRDSTVLAHVDDPQGSSPASLARHLGVAASTLSAALTRLEREGLLSVERDPGDGRRRVVRLTEGGRQAIARESVLDPERVARLLSAMAPDDRAGAVRGLKALASAARRLRDEEAR